MQAHKITLTAYRVGDAADAPMFDVRESLVNLLFHPDLKLKHTDALKHERLAANIMDEPSEAILLTDEEYDAIMQAVGVHRGWTRQQLPLLHRIQEAETVDVAEAKRAE